MSTTIETIRPYAASDAAPVAALFQAVMRGVKGPPPAALTEYFRSHFLDGPFADPDMPSLVHVSGQGEIDGFIGVARQPMRMGDSPLRAAILGNLMVRDHARSPMTGARLLKRAFAGPQDITLSETAGDASLVMWRQLGGSVLDRHSLDFVRVLYPARFALGTLEKRFGRGVRLFSPLARLLDASAARKPGPVRWSGLPAGFRAQGGAEARPVSAGAFADLASAMLSHDAIVPVWPDDCLAGVIGEAANKPGFGQAHLCEVTTRAGKAIGGFLLHQEGDGPARVTDIVHGPGQAGPVLDALFAYAHTLGAAWVQGRTTPHLLDALLSRRTLFIHESASVIDARDPLMLDAFKQGQVHFNGLVGERWTRFIGGSFA